MRVFLYNEYGVEIKTGNPLPDENGPGLVTVDEKTRWEAVTGGNGISGVYLGETRVWSFPSAYLPKYWYELNGQLIDKNSEAGTYIKSMPDGLVTALGIQDIDTEQGSYFQLPNWSGRYLKIGTPGQLTDWSLPDMQASFGNAEIPDNETSVGKPSAGLFDIQATSGKATNVLATDQTNKYSIVEDSQLTDATQAASININFNTTGHVGTDVQVDAIGQTAAIYLGPTASNEDGSDVEDVVTPPVAGNLMPRLFSYYPVPEFMHYLYGQHNDSRINPNFPTTFDSSWGVNLEMAYVYQYVYLSYYNEEGRLYNQEKRALGTKEFNYVAQGEQKVAMDFRNY